MFGRSLADGFDIILGNPPYISVERFAGTKIQAQWQKAFTTYAAAVTFTAFSMNEELTYFGKKAFSFT